MNPKRIIILSMITVFTLSALSTAQPQGERWRDMMGPERIEKYKKMRLLEVLELQEESAVRFNAKYNLHEDKIRETRKSLDSIQDKLEKILRKSMEQYKQQKFSEKQIKELQYLIEQIETNRFDINREEERFSKELRELFSPEQLAKYYLFQRNFEQELREAIREMRKDMPRHRMRD